MCGNSESTSAPLPTSACASASLLCRLLVSFLPLHPLRLEPRLVAQVDEDHAVQVGPLELRPAPARHLGQVGPVRALPGPLHGWLAVPGGRSPVHVALDVAELEVAGAVLLELEERLDLLIEVVLVPPGHRDDVPEAGEGRGRLSLLPGHGQSDRAP